MPVGLWLSSPALHAGTEQGRYMPLCSCQPAVTSQARLLWLKFTQQAQISNNTPSKSQTWVLNLWCYSASHHFICMTTMTDTVWRQPADPECPHEHPQVSQVLSVQGCPAHILCTGPPVPHTASPSNSLLADARHRSSGYYYCADQ